MTEPVTKKRGTAKAEVAHAPSVKRINVTEPYSVREWADRYGCTPAQIKDAVALVGNVATDVELHLRGDRPTAAATDASDALRAAFRE